MAAHEGFGVHAGAVGAAAEPVSAAETTLRGYVDAVEAACAEARAAAGWGPLGHALADLSTHVGARARERADVCHLLARQLHDTAVAYRAVETDVERGLTEARRPR